eukprot:6493898-Alexandrium_andersonii.AAC.1
MWSVAACRRFLRRAFVWTEALGRRGWCPSSSELEAPYSFEPLDWPLTCLAVAGDQPRVRRRHRPHAWPRSGR